MRKLMTIAVFLTILMGCSGAGQTLPEERNIQRITIVNHDYDTTWESVIESHFVDVPFTANFDSRIVCSHVHTSHVRRVGES